MNITDIAREAGSIDSPDTIETTYAAFRAFIIAELAGVEMPERLRGVCVMISEVGSTHMTPKGDYVTLNQCREAVAAAVAKTNTAWQVVNGVREAERDALQQKMVDGVTIQQYINMDNEVDALKAEVERLTACLKKANDNHEEFERKWYLSQQKAEQLREDIYQWQTTGASPISALEQTK
jgi:hypothetical protein